MFGRTIYVAAAVCLTASTANAASFHYNDEAGFDALAGTTISVPLPDADDVGVGPYAVGPLTFTSNSGALFFGGTDHWSTLIAGEELAISGKEEFTLEIAGGTTALSFLLHQPGTSTAIVDGCNAACVASTFSFSIYSGATLLDSFIQAPSFDLADFFGFYDAGGFDKIVITETVGTNDNEFFGEFRIAATVIPLPATLPLLCFAGTAKLSQSPTNLRLMGVSLNGGLRACPERAIENAALTAVRFGPEFQWLARSF